MVFSITYRVGVFQPWEDRVAFIRHRTTLLATRGTGIERDLPCGSKHRRSITRLIDRTGESEVGG